MKIKQLVEDASPLEEKVKEWLIKNINNHNISAKVDGNPYTIESMDDFDRYFGIRIENGHVGFRSLHTINSRLQFKRNTTIPPFQLHSKLMSTAILLNGNAIKNLIPMDVNCKDKFRGSPFYSIEFYDTEIDLADLVDVNFTGALAADECTIKSSRSDVACLSLTEISYELRIAKGIFNIDPLINLNDDTLVEWIVIELGDTMEDNSIEHVRSEFIRLIVMNPRILNWIEFRNKASNNTGDNANIIQFVKKLADITKDKSLSHRQQIMKATQLSMEP